MGVEDVEPAIVVAVGDQVLTEVAKGPHLRGRELDRPADHVPAGRLPGERNLHVVTTP